MPTKSVLIVVPYHLYREDDGRGRDGLLAAGRAGGLIGEAEPEEWECTVCSQCHRAAEIGIGEGTAFALPVCPTDGCLSVGWGSMRPVTPAGSR